MPITRVEDSREPQKQDVYFSDISIGATFFGNLAGEYGLYIRGHREVIRLTPPTLTWQVDLNRIVRKYCPVNCHIHIEGEGFNDGDAEERTKRIL